MISESQKSITAKVVSTAEDLEDDNIAPHQFETLDQYFRVGVDGTVREITLITETGGPQMEIDVASGIARGFNGGDDHATHFHNPHLQDGLWDYWTDRYEESR